VPAWRGADARAGVVFAAARIVETPAAQQPRLTGGAPAI